MHCTCRFKLLFFVIFNADCFKPIFTRDSTGVYEGACRGKGLESSMQTSTINVYSTNYVNTCKIK